MCMCPIMYSLGDMMMTICQKCIGGCHKHSKGSCSKVNISSSWYDDYKVGYHDILSDSKSL